jgi:hypothetical protein
METHPWIRIGRFGLLVRKDTECWQDALLKRKMKNAFLLF